MVLCVLGLAFILPAACSPAAVDETELSDGSGEAAAAMEEPTLPAVAITVVAAIEAADAATVESPPPATEETLPPTNTPKPESQPSPTNPVIAATLTQLAPSPAACYKSNC